jgi:hypothetical protein
LLNEFKASWSAKLFAASFFGVSYTWADMLNWSFFSYIFVHALAILAAYWMLARALRGKTPDKSPAVIARSASVIASPGRSNLIEDSFMRLLRRFAPRNDGLGKP